MARFYNFENTDSNSNFKTAPTKAHGAMYPFKTLNLTTNTRQCL